MAMHAYRLRCLSAVEQVQSNLFDVFDDNAAIQGKFADFTPHYVIEKL